MKGYLYIKTTLPFVLPFFLIIVTICYINPSPDFKFNYLKNNCTAQSVWMYKRIYIDSTPVNSAFFGSSHTLQAINDSLIPGAINSGYCRFGRDIQFVLFKDFLERKKIKTAFFEITEIEPSYSHPDYPFLAQNGDVFLPSFIYNQAFLSNRYDAFLYRLAYIRHCFFGSEIKADYPEKKSGYVGHDGIADSATMESEKKAKLESLKGYNPNTISRKTELTFSAHYLRKIKKLAEENNCKAYFIYLPAYGNNVKNSLDSAFYKSYFETIIPPDSILNVYSNWHDEAHLNDSGSLKITKWLVRTQKF